MYTIIIGILFALILIYFFGKGGSKEYLSCKEIEECQKLEKETEENISNIIP